MILWITTNYEELLVCTSCSRLWHMMIRFPVEANVHDWMKKWCCCTCFNLPINLIEGLHKRLKHHENCCLDITATEDSFSFKTIMKIKGDFNF